MKKFLFIAILAAGIGLLGWQIYQKASASKKGFDRQRRNVPVAVEIAHVKKSTIQDMGYFTGSLYPLSKFIVAPKIGGRLEKILVHIGDTVRGGQLVAKLDDEEYRQLVSQAKAELEEMIRGLKLNGKVEMISFRRSWEAQNIDRLAQAVERNHVKIFDKKPGILIGPLVSMWRDMNVFNEAGIPSLTYGPGESQGGGNRVLSLDHMYKITQVYALLALDLCNQEKKV